MAEPMPSAQAFKSLAYLDPLGVIIRFPVASSEAPVREEEMNVLVN